MLFDFFLCLLFKIIIGDFLRRKDILLLNIGIGIFKAVVQGVRIQGAVHVELNILIRILKRALG